MFTSRSFSSVDVVAEIMATSHSHAFSPKNMMHSRFSVARPRNPAKAASGGRSTEVVNFRSASVAVSQAKRGVSVVEN
jgi:hypothetical protein